MQSEELDGQRYGVRVYREQGRRHRDAEEEDFPVMRRRSALSMGSGHAVT